MFFIISYCIFRAYYVAYNPVSTYKKCVYPGVFDLTIYFLETETPKGVLLSLGFFTDSLRLYFAGDGTCGIICLGNLSESLARNPIPLRLRGFTTEIKPTSSRTRAYLAVQSVDERGMLVILRTDVRIQFREVPFLERAQIFADGVAVPLCFREEADRIRFLFDDHILEI